jgi:hypothetical protein
MAAPGSRTAAARRAATASWNKTIDRSARTLPARLAAARRAFAELEAQQAQASERTSDAAT